MIDDSRKDSLFVPEKDKAVAKLAKEKGGDAVILKSTDREISGYAQGVAAYRENTKMFLVEYLD